MESKVLLNSLFQSQRPHWQMGTHKCSLLHASIYPVYLDTNYCKSLLLLGMHGRHILSA